MTERSSRSLKTTLFRVVFCVWGVPGVRRPQCEARARLRRSIHRQVSCGRIVNRPKCGTASSLHERIVAQVYLGGAVDEMNRLSDAFVFSTELWVTAPAMRIKAALAGAAPTILPTVFSRLQCDAGDHKRVNSFSLQRDTGTNRHYFYRWPIRGSRFGVLQRGMAGQQV